MPVETLAKCDYLIAGGGIIGLTIARSLLERGAANILIIEKEPALGVHASGRNSGVLHAGIYYNPGTLKAKFCLDGNRLMKAYCLKNNLVLKEYGKVIVARDESEIEILYELKNRAESSGSDVRIISIEELKEIEPCAMTTKIALLSPETATVNPKTILKCIEQELLSSTDVRIFYKTQFKDIDGQKVLTNKGIIEFNYFINCAGAYADKICHKLNLANNYRLIPFKGTYYKLRDSRKNMVKGNIYPVPDLRNPFLGVHFSRSYNDRIYIGPTAIPAFGRENYGIFEGLEIEGFRILALNAILLVNNEAYKSAALQEPAKYIKQFFYNEAKKLVPSLQIDDLVKSAKVGIRPQLVDLDKKELVMDFIILQTENSLHVLNAISPAWTSSMSFSKYIVKNYINFS